MTPRRALVACAFACAALGAGACSLLLPFDELSGGASDAAGAVETSHADDATDAPATESAAVEASSDTGSRYPEGSWCATQPPGMVLCDDFDFETTAFERWTANEFQVQASGGFSGTAESPPRSLEISVPYPFTANTFFVEYLEESVPPDPDFSSLSLSFAFQPGHPWDAGGGDRMSIFSISQGPGLPRSAVYLYVGQGGTQLFEQLTSDDAGTTFPSQPWVPTVVDTGHWTHVAIAIDFSVPTATLSLEGTTVFTIALQGAWSASAVTDVYLGDWYISSTNGFDLLFDDAVIRQH